MHRRPSTSPRARTSTAARPAHRPGLLPLIPLLPLLLALLACGGDEAGDGNGGAADGSGAATARGGGSAALPADSLERGRRDDAWKRYTGLGGGAAASDTVEYPESWEDIAPETVDDERVHVPIQGDAAGPSVLAVQILLDRALYRPGVIDGRFGKNTEKAVYWMQEAEGLEAHGRVDEATFRTLGELAGEPERLIVERTLGDADVEGPFTDLPEDVYERAALECLCYESLGEKLAERFHTTPDLLRKLNPGIDLAALGAGDRLHVPDVGPFDVEAAGTAGGVRADRGEVAELVVSDGGFYVHALDASGEVLYHFPSTLGSEYAPSPSGDFEITSVHQDPTWHYQPDLLTGVDPSKDEAVLPAGPNNAVGVVWMELSKPHYGIHGTSAPETIGYVTSHGCVRLTNWDAEFLSHRVGEGVPVRFVDGTRRAEEG